MYRVVPFLRHIQKDFKFDSRLSAEQREERIYNAIFSARSKESVNSNASTIELDITREGKSALGPCDLTDDDSIKGYRSGNNSSTFHSKNDKIGESSSSQKLRRKRKTSRSALDNIIQKEKKIIFAEVSSIDDYMLSDEYIANIPTSSSSSDRYV